MGDRKPIRDIPQKLPVRESQLEESLVKGLPVEKLQVDGSPVERLPVEGSPVVMLIIRGSQANWEPAARVASQLGTCSKGCQLEGHQ